MTTPATPEPEPLTASSTGDHASDNVPAARQPGETSPGCGNFPGRNGQEPSRDHEDDEYEPLV